MEFLAEALSNFTIKRALDVATGSGRLLQAILPLISGCQEIIGIDLEELSVTQARKLFIGCPEVKFHQMSAEEMSFPSGYFDLVSISNALHHLHPQGNGLKEIKRVMAVDGHFLVVEFYHDHQSPSQMSHVLYHHFCAEIDTRNDIYHGYTFKRQEIIDQLKKASFQIDAVFDHYGEQDNLRNSKFIDFIIDSMEQYITKAQHFHDFYKFEKQREIILGHLDTHGISQPTQLVIIGSQGKV